MLLYIWICWCFAKWASCVFNGASSSPLRMLRTFWNTWLFPEQTEAGSSCCLLTVILSRSILMWLRDSTCSGWASRTSKTEPVGCSQWFTGCTERVIPLTWCEMCFLSFCRLEKVFNFSKEDFLHKKDTQMGISLNSVNHLHSVFQQCFLVDFARSDL